MITFHGVDLESYGPVWVEDIRVSPIQMTPLARQRPVTFGQEFVRMQGGNRTVTVTFALLNSNIEKREKQLLNIVNWARPATGSEYSLVLPFNEGKHLECICTSLPEPSHRQWWESKLRLVFTTFSNPYWTSDDETRVKCGTQMSIGGNAPPLIRITRTLKSKAANQSYTDGSRTMEFSTIPAGDLVIDLNAQTAAVSGSSIMGNITTTSRFILPRTGNRTITGTGYVYYRERWV